MNFVFIGSRNKLKRDTLLCICMFSILKRILYILCYDVLFVNIPM
jgi:hypothetical protein